MHIIDAVFIVCDGQNNIRNISEVRSLVDKNHFGKDGPRLKIGKSGPLSGTCTVSTSKNAVLADFGCGVAHERDGYHTPRAKNQ